MTFARPMIGLVAALATGLLALQARAQDYRPDAEGYPCAARGKLAIVQDDQGYSIRNRQTDAHETRLVTATEIAIGAALKLDATLFERPVRSAQEARDASRR